MVQVHGLSFAHAAVPVLSDVHLQLGPGWAGLVGENGAGKSTLLRLFAGELRPDRGVVRVAGRVARCPQEVDRPPDGAVPPDLAGRLALQPLARWATLSPGERRRWQIAAALTTEPDVLLLDEPGNHLDEPARAWLIGALRRFRGVGVLVAHDRALLDALTTTTLRVIGGGVQVWPGGYSQAHAAWTLAARAAHDDLERRQAEVRAARHALADARRDRDAAQHTRSAAARMKDRHDHDARGALAKGRAAMGEAAAGDRVHRHRGRLARAEASLAEAGRPGERGGVVLFPGSPPPRRTLLALDAALRVGDRTLVARHQLDRAEKVWLRGPNGAGKSTIVRALLAASTLPPERVVFLPQELDDAERAADVARLAALPRDARGRLLAVAACLGLDAARVLAAGRTSPGEARQLRIAMGLSQEAWLLVFDEPTHHLDLPAVERLEAALATWPGALLLVTHDEAFARRCTSGEWRVSSTS